MKGSTSFISANEAVVMITLLIFKSVLTVNQHVKLVPSILHTIWIPGLCSVGEKKQTCDVVKLGGSFTRETLPRLVFV